MKLKPLLIGAALSIGVLTSPVYASNYPFIDAVSTSVAYNAQTDEYCVTLREAHDKHEETVIICFTEKLMKTLEYQIIRAEYVEDILHGKKCSESGKKG